MIVTEAIAHARWSPEYQAIRDHYADRVARVSGVPLMQQVEEGLIILDALDASEDVMRAFCLRPLFQTDGDLVRHGQNFMDAVDASPFVILLVTEYRSKANAWLSEKVHRSSTDPQQVIAAGLPSAGPLEGVKDMLIADKVQGRKEFVRHQRGRHARSDELDLYFELWLQALKVDPEEYDGLCASIDMAGRRN
ncbi:hypothetical protein QN397_24695 [Variovorax sp. RTB1]|uniref:hypothetical protein n=1 Tax=Variovorax sp. RTB1 TaxID=3048631 RepID=UPI002B229645|nr:hypothetical protein [Variovorax sp. RTB1]MEB0114483.1 hypothetical protein [Variovorax sp. RTB1]